LVLVCSTLLSACLHRPAAPPVSVPKPAPIEAPRPRDEIAENTIVVVSLVRSIGSRLSQNGQLFKARLTGPLRATSGAQLAVNGAAVTGTVVSRPDGLGLRFDEIDTVSGPVRLRARLLEILPKTSMEVTNLERDAGGADMRICAAGGIQAGKPRAQKPSGIAQCRGTVLLRAGTTLRLQLFDVRKSQSPMR
jgi:hypothetical protein